ncbi:prickle planar cell polarity protein 3 [Trichonephila clavata]|uniref:Prickle planar cell polarity protein 3 n=1 Tax=Trichonephila clavata TaxID=2740835 RepID=A0A8X6I1Q6_TRICU|nr:prickle planar cell polarity protein 3 [Trichonephila clavata]
MPHIYSFPIAFYIDTGEEGCSPLCSALRSFVISLLTICNNCKCPREAHDVCHEEFVNVCDRIGFQPSPEPSRHPISKERTLSTGYSWVPPGLSNERIEEYFSQLPNHLVPQLGTPGEKYRDRQLILQLPKQDLAAAYCKFLEKDFVKNFEDFVNTRNEMALDIGYVRDHLERDTECKRCSGDLSMGELCVVAPKLGEDVSFHPSCFFCTVCEELLVDLTYCILDGVLYCERHYAEQTKPRCSACDEVILIFSPLKF